MTGAESLLHTLLANHIDICFMNPGTSEMQFASALDLLGLFEGVCSTLGRSLTTSSHLQECRHPPSRVRSGPEPLLAFFPSQRHSQYLTVFQNALELSWKHGKKLRRG